LTIDAQASVRWRKVAPPEIEAVAAQARRDLKISEFQHDPAWLNAERSADSDVRLFAARSANQTVGLLCARAATREFEYTAGGRVLLRRTVRQITVHEGPAIGPDAGDGLVDQAFVALAKDAEPGAIVYVSSVPVGSATHRVLSNRSSALRRSFDVLAWGEENPHFKIQWDGSIEGYFASLNPKRRGNARRAYEKFKTTVPHELRCFRSPAEADAFLLDATSISSKSYQSHELGIGLESDAGRQAQIRFAAARDSFLAYILYVEGAPAAYRYGYIYGDTLFAVSTAYDPAWSEHKPGAVIFLAMLYDIAKQRLPIKLIDLLPHDNSFKRDRSNLVIQTQGYFLFPRSLFGRSLSLPIRGIEGLKGLVSRLRGPAR
jgi:CelD/BcsL family acetyltransferase involved in cellulose biosynthesis